MRDEIGDLKDYEQYLSSIGLRGIEEKNLKKSAISGKNVYTIVPNYKEGSKFVSFDEVDFSKKFEPLTINEIKDIDSISEAIKERFSYVGNIIIGNSSYVEESSNIGDSNFVLNSYYIFKSNYVAYSSKAHNGKYVFGTKFGGDFEYIISLYSGGQCARCFSTWMCSQVSDIYYSMGIVGSQDVLFSFGILGKKHVIGNLQLAPDKYRKTKEKLIEDMRIDLEKNKELPLVWDLIGKKPISIPDDIKEEALKIREEKKDRKEIERAFSATTNILLKRKLEGIDEYKKYLVKYAEAPYKTKCTLTGETIYLPHDIPKQVIEKRVCNLNFLNNFWDRFALGNEQFIENAGFSGIKHAMNERGLLSDVDNSGNNMNNIDCVIEVSSQHCLNVVAPIFSQYLAYSYWGRHSTYLFGCNVVFDSSFCIRTNFSLDIKRGFEVDNCSHCSDIYFSHNCEGVQDSMFCFNAKSKTHAIGNAKLETSQYAKIKEKLLQEIGETLEKNKDYKWDIFDIIS